MNILKTKSFVSKNKIKKICQIVTNLNEKLVELNAYNHPLKRNAKVEDITPTIKLLLSEDSNYINGINIPITGGSIS